MNKLTYTGAAVTTAFLLTACGGGGSDSDNAPVVTPPEPTTPVDPTPDALTIDEGFAQYLTDLSANVIIPGYENLTSEAQDFFIGTQSFCALTSPSTSDLDAVRAQWTQTNLAWQSIQWVGVGGIASGINPIDFRIQFFPDPSDVVTRAVEDLLDDPNVVTADFVATQNVGGQGLPALELLLYPDNESDSLLTATDGAKRCEVLLAVAENVENISTEVLDSWLPTGGNFQEQLITGSGEFTSIRDAIEELVTNWLEHVESVKDDKLLAPLGSTSPGIITISEHFRSAQSIAAIAANLDAIETLFVNADGLGYDSILIDILEQDQIAQDMQSAIDTAQDSVAALSADFDSLEQALSSDAGRAQVNVIIEDLRVIRDFISIEFIQALDISIGFNSNDGD